MNMDDPPHTDDFYVSTEDRLLDLTWVTNTLLGTGWGAKWTHDMVVDAIRNSICFGLYQHKVAEGGSPNKDRQVGFARVVTDHCTFSWLADVVIDPEYRGRKLGTFLVAQVCANPVVAKVPCLLRTKDAGPLYEKFGFVTVNAYRRMPLREAL